MATKITTAVFALIMGLSFNSFAGTPETKGDANTVKSEAPANSSSSQTMDLTRCYKDQFGVYHLKNASTDDCSLADPNNNCNYEYIGDETPETDQDASHYVPTGVAGFRWQP